MRKEINSDSYSKDLFRSELASLSTLGTARFSFMPAYQAFTRRLLARDTTSRANLSVLLFILFAVLFIFPSLSSVHAAKLDFSPNSKSVAVGESFEIATTVDTAGVEILGVDALIEYDAEALTLDSVSDGTFLKIGKKETGTVGKVYIAGVIEDPGSAKSGTGTLATLKFTAKKDSTNEVKYICELGETNESNISKNDIDATDIIECAQNGKATIVIGGGGSGSVIPTGSDSAPPSTLPRSGAAETMMAIGLLGGVLLLVGAGTFLIR